MNRQVAFAYAATGVAASIAAIVMIGSAFGFALPASTPDTEGDWVDPATAEAATAGADYEAQQAAYEQSLADYQQSQADAIQAQIDADWTSVLDQRTAAQAAAAADVAAQREAGLQSVEAQLTAQQQAAAAELQAWIDEQRAAALDQLTADIGARDQAALDDLEARLGATQSAGSPPPSTPTAQYIAVAPPQPAATATATPSSQATPQPTAQPTPNGSQDSEHAQELAKKINECEHKSGEEREECFEEVAKKRAEWGL
jgi:hypothetical protein